MQFYLIYIPAGNSAKWEAMSQMSVPDIGAFPSHWYKKYEVENSAIFFHKLAKIRDKMNQEKIQPSKEIDIFPKLEDILNST